MEPGAGIRAAAQGKDSPAGRFYAADILTEIARDIQSVMAGLTKDQGESHETLGHILSALDPKGTIERYTDYLGKVKRFRA